MSLCPIVADQLNFPTYSLELSQQSCKIPENKLFRNAVSKSNTVTKHCLRCERAASYSGLFWCICVSKQTTSFGVSPSFSTQIGVTAALLTTIIGVISVNQTWAQEWDVIPISLQVSRLKSPLTTCDGQTSQLVLSFRTKVSVVIHRREAPCYFHTTTNTLTRGCRP